MSQKLFIRITRGKTLLVRLICALTVMFLAGSWLLPAMMGTAEAATGQITNRSLTLGSGIPSKSTSYSFAFTTVATGFHLDGIKLIACTTAVGSYPDGSCTIPPGFSFASATYGSITGFDDTTAFTIDAAGGGDCVATLHPEVLCLKRTSSANDTAATPKTLVINAVTNPSTANSAFYVGITTYAPGTTNWDVASRKDAGTTAAAVVQSLTVKALVAEILNFCVGSTSIDNATSDPTNSGNHDCSVISGTTVNIGTLDSSAVNVSPVSTNGGDGNNGIAMVRSNAGNGTVVDYDAIQASTGTNHLGTLRITGDTCDPSTVNTDGCINAIGTTQATLTAGTEDFGMTVAAINCGSTTAYSCVYSTGNYNLKRTANYDGTGSDTYPTDSGAVSGTTNAGYAWDESGSPVTIATSAGSTVKQIDDEALILKFAATPNIITKFGAYSVSTDYIAIPTY